ncbi:ABC transporter permease subunit [Nakamurella sp. YIM 132087]|uniref:ABC transporter permease subunit n=1 Tax=Nakamurella alba TaxID=2665158 RepID=A0A7K1FMA1_9ACTN|nr:ABC transporter permease [Nakamurella alba]MTD14449.1 ABC transporter permease subunit [Nakamurella alba]
MFADLWDYLTTARNWNGGNGLWQNILDHLSYSFFAIALAAIIAVPLGLWIGHTNKGGAVIVGLVNASRALPTFGLMVLLYILIAPNFTGRTELPSIIPVEIVLFLMAVPPLLSNAYAGVQQVDPAIKDAAKGMGMTGSQVLWRVELPNAYPLMMSGLRSATLQVIATATIGAFVSLGGLGDPIRRGISQGAFQDNATGHLATGRLLAGALLVTLLALVLDLILATIQRFTTSRGITGRYRKHLPGPADLSVQEPVVAEADPVTGGTEKGHPPRAVTT